jgi:hypothetical protein
MKRISLGLGVLVLSIASVVSFGASSADAAYNLTGSWTFTFGNIPGPCPGSITQTYSSTISDDVTITWDCPFFDEETLAGTLDKSTGDFLFGNVFLFHIIGTASDSNTVSGHWTGFPSSFGGQFSGSGGNGDPKLPSPTPTATATPTPRPVGGVAFDTTSRGSEFGAWWVAALVGVAFVVVGGAAFARRN